jgi:hypothetical protein
MVKVLCLAISSPRSPVKRAALRREHSRRESARAHQEINFHLNAVLRAGMIDMA